MRYSKDHKTETHERIVKNASVRLRERGAASLGVAELMKEAGLTHGGFYAHFASRDALIGEAFAYALEQMTRRWRRRAEKASEGKELAAIVDGYLNAEHRDNVGHGCALSALGSEAFRASPKTRKAFAAKIEEMIGILEEAAPRQGKTARRNAVAGLSTMIGALILARAAGTGELSDEILEVGRAATLSPQPAAAPRARKATAAKRPAKSA